MKDWPKDGDLTFRYWDCDVEGGKSETWAWSNGDCATTVEINEGFATDRITTDDSLFELRRDEAWIDGVCIGTVDEQTLDMTGPCS